MLDTLTPLTITPATVEDRHTRGRKKREKMKTNDIFELYNSEHTHMIALISCQASSLLDIGNDMCIGN